MTKNSTETLFARYRDDLDLDALSKVFDRTAPQLRRLALRLAREQADDVVQETFLRAIEQASSWDEKRPLMPWLLGILTHRAQHAWRDGQRTPNPDRMPEREVPQPDEVLAQSEFQEHLEKALAALSPPLRQAVQGALFDRQTPTQLAVDLGLQPGTLRQRLRRGLGQLRVALQASLVWLVGLFGLRSTGLAGVRARVLESAAQNAPQGAVALSGASSGMRWAGLAVMLALVGWVGVELWPDSKDAGDQGGSDTSLAWGGENQQIADRDEENSAALVGLAEADRQVQAEAKGLQVEVLWKDTELPAEGRSVTLSLTGREKRHGTTNAAGKVRFELSAEDRPLLIAADATAMSPQAREYIGRSEREADLVLYVHNGGSLSGQVLGPDDQPIPQATVQGWCGTPLDGPPDRVVQTDAQGNFTVLGLGESFKLLAHRSDQDAEWVAADGLQGKLQAGDELTGHVLRVAKPGKMVGIVLLPDGQPAADVELAINHQTGSGGAHLQTHDLQVARFLAGAGSARSNADGRFAIEALPPGNHHVTAKRTPFLVYGESHGLAPEEVTIRLDAGESLQGSVVDMQGLPIPGAEIRFWPYYGNVHTTPLWTPVNSETGRFDLRGMSSAKARYGQKPKRGLLVRAPGHALFALEALPESLGEIAPLRIQMLPEKVIEGVVWSGDGTPAEGLAVRIEGDRVLDLSFDDGSPQTWEKQADRNEVRTDAEGRFRFPQLYAGQFDVQVFADATREKSLTQTTRAGNRLLEFRLIPESLRKVAFLLEVTDALTGLPVQDFRFQHWIDGWGNPKDLVAVDGRWEVSGLESGEFGIGIVADGYQTGRLDPKFYGFGEHEILIALWPLRSLEVLALDSAGERMPAVRVKGTGPGGKPIHFLSSGGRSTTNYAIREDQGTIHGLPAGLVSLEFESGDLKASLQLDLTVPREEPVEVRFSAVGQGPGVEQVRQSFLVWEFKAANELAPGESPTIPQGVPTPAGADSGTKAFVEKVRGGKLQTPEFAFTILIERPGDQRPVRVKYSQGTPNEFLSEALEAAEAPATEAVPADVPEVPEPRMTLSVQYDQAFTTMEVESQGMPDEMPETTQPLDVNFPTHPGECFLRLTSEHYETIELRWFAESRDEEQMPPTLLLKRKR